MSICVLYVFQMCPKTTITNLTKKLIVFWKVPFIHSGLLVLNEKKT